MYCSLRGNIFYHRQLLLDFPFWLKQFYGIKALKANAPAPYSTSHFSTGFFSSALGVVMAAQTSLDGSTSLIAGVAHTSLPPEASFLVAHINNLEQVTLSFDNFFVWTKQLKNALRIGNLVGYLDGSKTYPAPLY